MHRISESRGQQVPALHATASHLTLFALDSVSLYCPVLTCMKPLNILHHAQDIRVSGATGPCSSGNNKSTLASEVELGMGGTTSWNMCVLNQTTSLGMFFETVAAHGSPLESGHILTLQFQTQYQHPCGQQRLRVTTVARPWAEPGSEQVCLVCITSPLRPYHKGRHCFITCY